MDTKTKFTTHNFNPIMTAGVLDFDFLTVTEKFIKITRIPSQFVNRGTFKLETALLIYICMICMKSDPTRHYLLLHDFYG